MAEDGPAVVVVGAGIAGLSAAYRLQQAGIRVLVVERQGAELVGGRMATVRRGGFDVDLGAPLLARRYRRMLTLLDEVGAGDQIVSAADVFGIPYAGQVFRGRTGSPWRLLRGGLLEAVPMADRLRLSLDVLRRRGGLHPADMTGAARWDTESLTGYADRRRLRRSTLDLLLDPLASTLCLSEPGTTAAMPALLFLAFLAGSGGLFTSARGTGFVPQALAARVPIAYHCEVTGIETCSGGVKVSYQQRSGGEVTRAAEAVVVATPPPVSAAVCPQVRGPLREAFAGTTYSRTIQVTFCLDRATAETAAYLFTPRPEAPDIAGITLPHNLSRRRVPEGKGMITVYLRGESSDRLWHSPDARIVDHTVAELSGLRILPEAERHSCAVYVDRLSPCVVRRRPGDYRRLADAVRTSGALPAIVWAGGDHFGHSTTIGSLTSGEQAAHAVLAHLAAQNPKGTL
ncbi:protoporphyrinogen/coproporphyrinogen oxidase [Nocardia sp. NPDC051570]|uniref:protoporphyrinogen/coproporphyrinogen oxidase n=1 Tax=Nocardia sp. NPDC051570 TaxID=3364324 RepID=UPI003794E628